MDACQEIDIDKVTINLIESLKHDVFKLGMPACTTIIDSVMGDLVDIGWQIDIITEARSRVYDIFIEFCSHNIGMMALSSIFKHSAISRESNIGKTSKINKNGYIYVAKITDGMVKIGRSKKPEMRLKSMQDNGRLKFSETFVSNLIPDYAKAEASIHKFFLEKRRTGEWFDITFDEAVLQVKELAKKRIEMFAEVHGKTLIPNLSGQKQITSEKGQK